MASDPTQPGGRQPGFLGDEEDADIPPSPLGAAADPLDDETQERLQRISRRSRTLPTLLVLGALGAFVAIVWWAYRTANVPETPAEVPVVEAPSGDEKVRPESEGGMDVPNQDKLIYEQLGEGEAEPEVERLLPPPEEPLQPPAPPAVEAPAPDAVDLTPPPPPQEVTPSATDEPAAVDASPADAEAEPGQAEQAEAAPGAPAAAPVEPVTPEAPAEAPAADTAPPAVETPAPQVAAAGDGFRVQLAAVKSEADANAEWAKLQKAHPDLLGGLKPTIQRADLGAQGVFYRIQGGPLASRDAATALCEALKTKNQDCLVVKP